MPRRAGEPLGRTARTSFTFIGGNCPAPGLVGDNLLRSLFSARPEPPEELPRSSFRPSLLFKDLKKGSAIENVDFEESPSKKPLREISTGKARGSGVSPWALFEAMATDEMTNYRRKQEQGISRR